jgi:RNase H-fold protein (predicted Holliday junction resolvase)
MVRKIMEELKERGVGEVVVGYPKEISRNHGNKLTSLREGPSCLDTNITTSELLLFRRL